MSRITVSSIRNTMHELIVMVSVCTDDRDLTSEFTLEAAEARTFALGLIDAADYCEPKAKS